MTYKIGVFGSSATGAPKDDVKQLARRLGQALGHTGNVVVVTGGCSGLPYLAAEAAHQAGTEIWAFSPVRSMAEQKQFTPDDNLEIYTKLIFIPEDLPIAKNRRKCMKYRNVLSTAECDAGIIISGQWGSLNEFTNLVDMQKIVGVLTGSGGIADELPALCEKIKKDGQGEVIFDDNPKKLVKTILERLKS
jgi:predicted Rossmann-fold nucleotide-binding protein